jgi:hypothetical protein
VKSGSNGSDGAFNPTTNIVINMADHPNGIYQYTSVNIPTNVTVTFIPNANNTPVYWLVQNNVVINGAVDVSGKATSNSQGGTGGPGGWQGGSGAPAYTSGYGPGGGYFGAVGFTTCGLDASYGTQGCGNPTPPTYGNIFLIPLLGGSGGGGNTVGPYGGGGGGGAILIGATGNISLNGGNVIANGGNAATDTGKYWGGAGSGGAIRLVATQIMGNGNILISGGSGGGGGQGRVRYDTYQDNFSGSIQGVFTQGSQFIIIPTSGQLLQLTVTSVGGVPVSASPTGALSTPDAVLSAQQNNPLPIVVSCANLPLNSLITVSVAPANGTAVSATGYNTTGTLASSTATISIVMPRGGGLIYATATTGN